jgi:phage tail sheath protein FI
MPEYLAPGVYVEEIDTGNKPIEGVSTSTAGMLGVTERGPVNVPILITGIGEYTRWFGERLNVLDFSDPNTGHHCYLPHAVEGFFTNGGKRVFITRVLDTDLAARAGFMLFNRGTPPFGRTVLLRAARASTGTAANPPRLVVLSGTNLALNDWVRIGDGSDAEYRQIAAMDAELNPTGGVMIPMQFPLSRSHVAATPPNVEQFARAAAGGALSIVVDPALGRTTRRGDQVIEVSGAQADISALVPNSLMEIGANANIAEHRFAVQVTPLTATTARVRLDSPLMMPYANGASVQRLNIGAAQATAQLDPDARASDTLLFVNNRNGQFIDRTRLIVIDQGNTAEREVRRIGNMRQATLSTGAAEPYPAGTIVEGVNLADGLAATLTAASAAGTNTITVSDVSTLRVGQTLLVGPAVGPLESVVVQAVNLVTGVVTLTANLGSGKAIGDSVFPLSLTAASAAGTNTITVSDVSTLGSGQTLLVGLVAGPMEGVVIQSINPTTRVVTLAANLATAKVVGDVVVSVRALTADAAAGASFVALNNRTMLQVGDVLRIGAQPDDEYALITGLPNRAPAGVGPDAGNAILAAPLVRSHARATTPVARQNPVTTTAVQPTVMALGAQPGETVLLLSDAVGYAAGNFLCLTTPTGVHFHRVAAVSGALAPQLVALNTALDFSHSVGAPVVERRPLLLVQALDAGIWGDRLRVSIEDEPAGLVARTTLANITTPTLIRLDSPAGVEAGTILEFVDAAGSVVGDPVKVQGINRANNQITLDGAGLGPGQVVGLGVRSREFSLTVRLQRQPDSLMPSRNDTVLDSETFRYLSMDPRHSRYVQTVLGDINGPLRLSDRRPKGESWYVRVHDMAQDLTEPARTNTLESIRLGPEALTDTLPDGRVRPARHRLRGGGDSIATLTDNHYIGQDDPTPENRTGLHSLRNIEEISLVASPGRISVQMQNALINHCELMRYRFAVLDARRPPQDTLADVQNQRQQFDTKYAALYHPWLLIPDPYPASLTRIVEYAIPPSGHVVGIYARTDIERGVHKAPANEVVRGVLGLQRVLNKEQQDILNPYPVNINVIRDFRPNNRGIRVFGGRCITSDSDWKYVNVRRLLIFIEASIDRGLQWVVFEPNAEPLWARVRRSISNFLTLVWRNGGLEGTKAEEAYFVKCDRTTMTQTDIDSGRLIVVVGVAPVKPAEFVIVRIGLWTARADN